MKQNSRISPEDKECLAKMSSALSTLGSDQDQRDLTIRAINVLLLLTLGRIPPSVRDIAVTLGVPKPAVSRAFDALEIRGLVQRVEDKNDRRIILGRLTPKAFKLLESVVIQMSD